jgi:NitT/TauT family transport system permease protein
MTAQVETAYEAIPERGAIASAFFRYLPLLILAAVWEVAARSGLVSQLALPSLSAVLVSWWDLMSSGDLVTNGLDSLWRLTAGLGMAISIGTMIGVLMAWYRPIDALLNPIVQVFYPMPKSALVEDRAHLHRLHAAGDALRL